MLGKKKNLETFKLVHWVLYYVIHLMTSSKLYKQDIITDTNDGRR